jgi:hypothetical protein
MDFGGVFHLKSLVGPLVIEDLDEPIELALLLQEVAARGPRGLGFERAMHPFMTPVRIPAKPATDSGASRSVIPKDGGLMCSGAGTVIDLGFWVNDFFG